MNVQHIYYAIRQDILSRPSPIFRFKTTGDSRPTGLCLQRSGGPEIHRMRSQSMDLRGKKKRTTKGPLEGPENKDHHNTTTYSGHWN